MYKKEQELLAHYNSNVNYSSVNVEKFFDLFPEIDFKDKKILDLGCGDGRFSQYLKIALGASPFGIDFSKERINKARKNSLGINYFCIDCYKYTEEYSTEEWGKFDLVLMTEVIEHLEDPKRLSLALSKISNGIFGSVPLNFPYIAHLQVFKNKTQFKKFFKEWDLKIKVIDRNIYFYGEVKKKYSKK